MRFIYLLKKLLDKNWNWNSISKRRDIFEEDIISNIDLQWCWIGLSYNPNISFNFVEKYIDKEWCWKGISNMKDINIDIILKYIDKDWDWNVLTCNIMIKNILYHRELPWMWNLIGNNKHLTIDIIENNKDIFLNGRCNFSENKNINIDFVLKYIYKYWDWEKLTENPSIGTFQNLLKYPKLPWKIKYNPAKEYNILKKYNFLNLENLVKNTQFLNIIKNKYYKNSKKFDLKEKYILKYPNNMFNWHIVSYHKNISFQFILNNLNLPWNWKEISHKNPNITINDVIENNNLQWKYEYISLNPIIKNEDIINNPNFQWNYFELSYNQNISLSFIKNHPFFLNCYIYNFFKNLNKNILYEDLLLNSELLVQWNIFSNFISKYQNIVNCQKIWRYYKTLKKQKMGKKINNWLFEIYMNPTKGFIDKKFK